MATYGHPSCMDMLSLPDPNLALVVKNGRNCRNWHIADHLGNLPTLGNPPIRYPMLFYSFWHHAKKSWQVANSTLPDPTQSVSHPGHHSIARDGPKRYILPVFWPWPLTFDLEIPKISNFPSRSMYMPKIKVIHRSNWFELQGGGTHRQTNGTPTITEIL